MRDAVRPVLLALAAVALSAACTDLPTIVAGTCGNGVVEAGEDCDTFAPGSLSCRAPGSDGACHLDCARDASGQARACPSGWGCGADALCRRPSGRFTQTPELVESGSRKLRMADVDGDGLADVIGTSASDVIGRSVARVHFFDDAGRLAKTSTIPALLSGSAVGDVTGDGLADVVGAVFLSGIATFAGARDRTPSPAAYPTLTVPMGASVRAITMDVLKSSPNDETLIFGTFGGPGGVVSTALAVATDASHVLLVLDHTAAELAGKVAIGPFVEGAPCDEIVIAFQGAPSIALFSPCRVTGGGKVIYNDVGPGGQPTVPPVIVTLPSGDAVGAGVLLTDLDADKHLDLVIDAGDHTLVAFGDGKGGFFPQPGAVGGALTAGPIALPMGVSQVVAIGRIDDDPFPDLVTPGAIYLTPSKTSILCPGTPADLGNACKVAENFGARWTEAVIADLNRDGLFDVIASSSSSNDLQFYGGTPTGLPTASTISTLGAVSHLTPGDFDGDLITDVAFAQAGAHGGAQTVGDGLEILFGRPSGPPEPPLLVGRFDRIEDIVSGSLGLMAKTTLDLGVTSRSEDGVEQTVAILAGNGDRELLAPFGLQIIGASSQFVASPLGATLAQVAGEARLDVVAVAYDGDKGPQTATTFRFWMAESQPRSRLGAPIASDPLPSIVQPLISPGQEVLFLRAGDLDGDGFDEIVYVGLDLTTAATSVVLIGSTGGAKAITLAAPMPLGRYVPPSGHVELGDVDADGHLDLVVLTRSVTSKEELSADATEVSIFWGIPGGFAPMPTAITAPGGATGLLDLALLVHDGGRDVAFANETTTWIAVRSDRTFQVVDPLVTGGTGLAAGDIDGDGVEDLAIASGGTVRIFRGEAAKP